MKFDRFDYTRYVHFAVAYVVKSKFNPFFPLPIIISLSLERERSVFGRDSLEKKRNAASMGGPVHPSGGMIAQRGAYPPFAPLTKARDAARHADSAQSQAVLRR